MKTPARPDGTPSPYQPMPTWFLAIVTFPILLGLLWAANVTGHGVPSGHWLPEEAPDQLVEEVGTFIDEHD